jgi:hypothetical protein
MRGAIPLKRPGVVLAAPQINTLEFIDALIAE